MNSHISPFLFLLLLFRPASLYMINATVQATSLSTSTATSSTLSLFADYHSFTSPLLVAHCPRHRTRPRFAFVGARVRRCVTSCFLSHTPLGTCSIWSKRRMLHLFAWCCVKKCDAATAHISMHRTAGRGRYLFSFAGCRAKINDEEESSSPQATSTPDAVISDPILTETPTTTASNIPMSTATSSPSVSSVPVWKPSMSETPSISGSVTPSVTPSPSSSGTSSPSLIPIIQPSSSSSSSPSSTSTSTPSPTPTSTPSPTRTSTTSPTPSPSHPPPHSPSPSPAALLFLPEQGVDFNAAVLRNSLEQILTNDSDPEFEKLPDRLRVMLENTSMTEEDFILSEPYAEQLTLRELALGEEEFYRRRRAEKKRISEEAERKRRKRERGDDDNEGADDVVSVQARRRSLLPEGREEEGVVFTYRNFVTDCLANRCGTKVTIWSPQYVRWKIITRAFDVLRARPSFSEIYEADRAKTIVRHVNGKKYAVLVPFSDTFYEEF